MLADPQPDAAMNMPRIQVALRTVLPVAALLTLVTVTAVGAQQGLPESASLGEQSLRPYWHVFVAYAIAVTLIGGWAVSIARRLRAIEDRLVD